MQSKFVPITYIAYMYYVIGSAYSDTAAVTSCSRQSQYVKLGMQQTD